MQARCPTQDIPVYVGLLASQVLASLEKVAALQNEFEQQARLISKYLQLLGGTEHQRCGLNNWRPTRDKIIYVVGGGVCI